MGLKVWLLSSWYAFMHFQLGIAHTQGIVFMELIFKYFNSIFFSLI